MTNIMAFLFSVIFVMIVEVYNDAQQYDKHIHIQYSGRRALLMYTFQLIDVLVRLVFDLSNVGHLIYSGFLLNGEYRVL